MIEVWYQWTCNGCGITENSTTPSLKRSEVVQDLRSTGWRAKSGDLHYCPQCVRAGKHKRREDIFSNVAEGA